MRKECFKKTIVFLLLFIVIKGFASANQEPTEIPSRFSYSYEVSSHLNEQGNNIFTKYIFDVKLLGKDSKAYRFEAFLNKSIYVYNEDHRDEYYETGYPVITNSVKPFLLNFLENKRICFSLISDKFVLHNLDSLRTSLVKQLDLMGNQLSKDKKDKLIKEFNEKYFRKIFSPLHIKLPDDIVNPDDYSMEGKTVFHYLRSYKNSMCIEITKIQEHEDWLSFIDKRSGLSYFTQANFMDETWISRIIMAPGSNVTPSYQTVISGRQWSPSNGTVDFTVSELSINANTKEVSCEANEKGEFELFLQLEAPAFLRMKNGIELYCEPGDDIQLLFSANNDSVDISGTGKANNEFLRQKEVPLDIKELTLKNKPVNNSRIFRIIDDEKSRHIDLLNLYKRDISPRLYEYEFASEYFKAINRKIFVLSRQVSFPYVEDPTRFEWAKLPVPSYQTLTFNQEYNQVLSFKLGQELDRLKNFKYAGLYGINQLSSLPDYLQLAEIHFKNKQLIDFLGSQAKIIAWTNNIPMMNLLEEIVNDKFPESPLASYITLMKKTGIATNIGSQFPELPLLDFDNQKAKLPLGKNKQVYIMFWRNEAFIINSEWEQYLKLIGECKDQDVIFINIGIDDQFNSWKEQVKTVPFPGLNYFLSKDSELYKRCFAHLKTRHYFLLDKNGIIVNNNGPEPRSAINEFLEKTEPSNRRSMLIGGLIGLVGMTLIAFIVIFLIKRHEKRKAKISGLKNQLREMEMKAIKSQMNPHFLFNSLNSIQSMINRDHVENANIYLSKFANLLRGILKNSDLEFIPFQEEIENTRLYCELEKLRFNFDFIFKIDPSIDLFNTLFPPLLLQPFIENAIIHGLHPKEAEKLLQIEIKEINQTVVCSIRDNGVGREKAIKNKNSNGIGIKLSQERISILNEKNKCNFEIQITDLTDEHQEPSGTEIVISFRNNLI